MNERAELCQTSVADIIFVGKASAVVDFRGLKMQNFDGEHLHVIKNVGCRCKICEGSIFKSQKRQDVDEIIHAGQAEKHLRGQRKASCRYFGLKKSICNSEYQGRADTTITTKASITLNKRDV